MKDVVVHSSRTHVIARSWGVSAWKAGRESELLPPARLFWCCFQSKQAATNTATLDNDLDDGHLRARKASWIMYYLD